MIVESACVVFAVACFVVCATALSAVWVVFCSVVVTLVKFCFVVCIVSVADCLRAEVIFCGVMSVV